MTMTYRLKSGVGRIGSVVTPKVAQWCWKLFSCVASCIPTDAYSPFSFPLSPQSHSITVEATRN